MEWLKLLIPLIAVAVWILSNMAKNKEMPRRVQPPPLPPPGDDEGRPRRTASDVDRFLEEVRRRRAQAEGGQAPPPLREPLKPKPPSRQPVPEQRRPTPPVAPPPPRRIPSPPPRMPAPAEILEAVIVPSPSLESRITKATMARAPVAVSVSTALALTVDLLKKKETLAAAVILREILGPPASTRPMSIPAFRK